MPLVIAVIVIAWIFATSSEKNSKSLEIQEYNQKAMRRTNASLESELANKYYEDGYSKADAVRKSYEDMTKAGYDPCIPIGAYQKTSYGLVCYNLTQHDSVVTNRRRDCARWQWRAAYPDKPCPDEWLHEQIYGTPFPKTDSEYCAERDSMSLRQEAMPVGYFFYYPGLGTCEVLKLNLVTKSRGFHEVRVVSTGEIKTIRIGDSRIQRLG